MVFLSCADFFQNHFLKDFFLENTTRVANSLDLDQPEFLSDLIRVKIFCKG